MLPTVSDQNKMFPPILRKKDIKEINRILELENHLGDSLPYVTSRATIDIQQTTLIFIPVNLVNNW